MKKLIVLGLIACGLAACADNRSSVSKDADTWERIQYEVGSTTERVKN